MQSLALWVDEGNAGRRGAALYGRSFQFERGAFDRGGRNQVHQGEGFTEAPGVGRCRNVPDDDIEELHLLLAPEFEHP